jgi:VWFA-related protein
MFGLRDGFLLQCAFLAFSSVTSPPALLYGQDSLTTISTTARIVYVQVVVRDGRGHVVHGLKQSDFTLKQDGKPQRIDLFEEYTTTTRGPAPKAGVQRGFSNLPDDPVDGSLNVVLLDLLDTAVTDQVYAKTKMIEFLKSMPPGKQVALFVLTNQLHMVQGFSADSSVLVKAAEGIKLEDLQRVRPVAQKLSDFDLESYSDSQATIPVVGAMLERSLQGEDLQNSKARLNGLADAFEELGRAVNGYAGRKNLFWLAGEFTSSTSSSLRAISTGQLSSVGPGGVGTSPLSWIGDPRSGTANRAGYSTTTPFSEKSDRAVADSQLAVYPISLTGVETDTIGADQNGIGTAGRHLQDTMAQTFHDRQESRSVMERVAEETGGEAFYGNNDVTGMLRRGFEDSENFYTLAFQPSNHMWNGKYRKLNVALNGGGTLSYRRGYYAMPEQPVANEAKKFQDAMRMESPVSTMLTLRAIPGLVAASASDGSKAVVVQTTVDVSGIGFTTDGEGKRHAKVVVGLMAYPVGVADPKAVQTSGTLNLNLTEEQYRQLLAQGLQVPQRLPLGSGKYLLRVGVMDHGSGRIGTLTVPVMMK